MTSNLRFGFILLAVAAVIVYMSTFIVHEREIAIKFKLGEIVQADYEPGICLLYTSPSPRDGLLSRMPSSA